jgi:cytochrome P450
MIEVDLQSEAFQRDPYSVYARLRREAPIWRHPDGYTMVSRYADVFSLLRAPGVISSAPMGGITPYLRPDHRVGLAVGSMIGLDPPRHGAVRELFIHHYLRRTVTRMEPRLAALAERLGRDMVKRGGGDLISDFGRSLPTHCIADVLGIRPERVDEYLAWSDRELLHHTPESRMQVMVEIARFMSDFIEERRRSPGADPVSLMIAAEADGRIDTDELVATTALLVVSGADETSRLVGNMVLALAEWPLQRDLVAADLRLCSAVVEETLRWDAPVQMVTRRAAAAFSLGGGTIADGEGLVLLLGSANRDESCFDKAERFDILRTDARRHLAFGLSPHVCIGGWMARLCARLLLEVILRDMPPLHLDRERMVPNPGFLVRGPVSLPVYFDS